MKFLKKIFNNKDNFKYKWLSSSKKRLTEEDTIVHKLENSKIIYIALMFILWISSVSFLIFNNNTKYSKLYLTIRQPAPENIYSNIDFSYINDLHKNSLSVENGNNYKIFRINKEKTKNIIYNFHKYVKNINTSSKIEIPKEYLKILENIVNNEQKYELLYNKLLYYVYRGILDDKNQSLLAKNSLITIIDNNNNQRKPIPYSPIFNLKTVESNFAKDVSQDYPPEYRNKVYKAILFLAKNILEPNLFYDQATNNILETNSIKKI